MSRFLVTLLLLWSAYPALACSCGRVGIHKSYKGANVVFTGTLVEAKVSHYNDTMGLHQGKYRIRVQKIVRFTFRVQHIYKGSLVADTVSLLTSGGGADCGSIFTFSKSYLIYSWFNDELPNDFGETRKVTPYITTSVCSRTKPNEFLTLYEKTLLTIL